MDVILSLLKNHVLICGIAGWGLAQITKVIIFVIVNKKFDAERLTGAGGMPSCHSSCVCAAAIACAKVCGVDSAEFAFAFLLAAIVIYDATGVRRAAGEHAKILNILVEEMPEEVVGEILERRTEEPGKVREMMTNLRKKAMLKKEKEKKDKDEGIEPLKEFLGHTPLEVIAGALFGILIAMVMPIF